MEEYEKMHLTLLRRVGRSKGVKNPSSLKKSELIEEIKKIDKGKATPYFTKRGRPPKQTEEIDNKEKKIILDKKREVKELIKKFEMELMKILEK